MEMSNEEYVISRNKSIKKIILWGLPALIFFLVWGLFFVNW